MMNQTSNRQPNLLPLLIAAIIGIAALIGLIVLLTKTASAPNSPSATPTPTPTVAADATPTGAAEPTWRTAAYEQAAPSGATTARLTAIRTAKHADGGYDRIAFDFAGAMPGYTVKPVTSVSRDGSGQAVSLPGSAYLQIVFNPAAAHTDAGASSLSNPPTSPVTTGYSQLKSYVLNGDFEGYVSLALGLASAPTFRTTSYPNGDHWTGYVDIRW